MMPYLKKEVNIILVDYSSIVHRMLYTIIKLQKPKKDLSGTLITSEFMPGLKTFIFNELFKIKHEHSRKYGDIVICLDNSEDGYWRKDVYSSYKANRKIGREKSEINFDEVYEDLNQMTEQINKNLPWKVVDVKRAEADDIMLVLAKLFSKSEIVLIHSPDKDMIQAQRETDNVQQYSGLTKKMIVPETKHASMQDWITEHVCLGDSSDEVPKVVDHTEFSESFLEYLGRFLPETDVPDIKTPMAFKDKLSLVEKREILKHFNVFKTNRKGESTGIKDVYKDMWFGPTNLKKVIKKFGTLDLWLDSNPLYRQNYNRNFILVMEEGIPDYIKDDILVKYKESKTDYNNKEFEEYLIANNMKSIMNELPSVFKLNRDLTADDFGW